MHVDKKEAYAFKGFQYNGKMSYIKGTAPLPANSEAQKKFLPLFFSILPLLTSRIVIFQRKKTRTRIWSWLSQKKYFSLKKKKYQFLGGGNF